MSTTRRRVPHPPAAVMALLADGQRYAEWVVGAKRVRGVDEGFPAVGTVIHHTVGVGPFSTDDTTEVLAFERPAGPVRLQARGWPAGEAQVTITTRPTSDGCEVQIHEVPTSGPAKALHSPVQDLLLHLRNVETLRRLERALDRQVPTVDPSGTSPPPA